MPPADPDPDSDDLPRLHPEIDPAIADALSDLDSRLEQRGWHARIWVNGDMTAVLVHRDGDTEATVDSAIADGRKLLDELAAEIAAERGLSADWLDRRLLRVEDPLPLETKLQCVTNGDLPPRAETVRPDTKVSDIPRETCLVVEERVLVGIITPVDLLGTVC